MLKIFVPERTNRIEYTFRLIFKDLLDIDFSTTIRKDEFIAAGGPKLSYCDKAVSDEVFIRSSGLLEAQGIQQQEINAGQYNKTPVLFPLHDKTSALPFDAFAAAFYMASRYEEYLPFKADKLGRFEAAAGIAHRNGFQRIPVVNIWAGHIRDILRQKYPEIAGPHRKFRFVPTYDIDIAYSYLNKGTWRSLASASKALLHGQLGAITERLAVIAKEKKDPFDCYDYLFELQEKYDLCPNYFIHAGSWGRYDKSISTDIPEYRTLLQRIGSLAEIGIHPSWKSTEKPALIKEEKMRLEEVIEEPITQARQHFIRLKFPETYRNFIAAGIIDDYSMGFASEVGFRAGLCSSFFFYDLEAEKETNLRIHPFALMEGTMKDYMGLTTDEALTEAENLMKQVAAVGGTFITIFHNESLGSSPKWAGWRDVYEEILKMAGKF